MPGGAATVLVLPLDPARELQLLTVHALANEVGIGLLAAPRWSGEAAARAGWRGSSRRALPLRRLVG